MTFTKIMFFVLAASIVTFSILSITSRRILRAAIYLLFVLVAMAGLYYPMMNFAFLAAVQLIVYIGGIVVLIIFSILLTSQINSKLEPPKRTHLASGLITAVGGIALSIVTVLGFTFKPTTASAVSTDMRTIGSILMGTSENGYALPFEVISILLLAALVGSIFIALKNRT